MEFIASFVILMIVFGAVWLMFDLIVVLTVMLFCFLFGTTPTPPTVPNKAVWG